MSGTIPSSSLWVASALLLAACGQTRTSDNTGVATGGPMMIAGRPAVANSGGRTGGGSGFGASPSGRTGGGAGSDSGHCEASAPPLSPATLPPAIVDRSYIQVLAISGASPSQVSWSVSGMLPPGLNLVPIALESPTTPPQAQAHLRGIPSMAGTFSFEVQASLTVSGPCAAAPAIRSYQLVVTGDPDTDAGAP